MTDLPDEEFPYFVRDLELKFGLQLDGGSVSRRSANSRPSATPGPSRPAERLHLLIEGTLVMGATRNHEHPALVARDLAAIVLDG